MREIEIEGDRERETQRESEREREKEREIERKREEEKEKSEWRGGRLSVRIIMSYIHIVILQYKQIIYI